jgi:biotin-dependent carboxylase-like uncharacterized protein
MSEQAPSTAALRVLAPGLHTLVVDEGRPATRSLGVPVGGAADRFSLALGNALVGNEPGAAALEVTLAGPTLEAVGELACVVYGAPFELASDRTNLRAGTTFTLRHGERLRIGGCPRGMRAYLCVAGGIRTPLILGSRSGLEALHPGAELPCLPGAIHGRSVRLEPEGEVRLRVLPGAQADWFPLDDFLAGPRFTVSPASNRMGLRLRGAPLPVPERELVSEPVCPGTVQVTRDGQCIILGVDGQTIGGYPKIAQVISADLDRVGQLRPGEEVGFERVSLGEAEGLYRRRRELLRQWVTRLRNAEVLRPGERGA